MKRTSSASFVIIMVLLLAGCFGPLVPTNQSPTATITSPSDNSTFAEDDTINFQGSATDPEDGTLTGGSLIWTSSIDGQIGTGESFSKSNLSVGTHSITLTATDSEGATDTDSITITVESANQPPTAEFSYSPQYPAYLDATAIGEGIKDETCTFDGSPSVDPTFEIAPEYIHGYEWDFSDGSKGSGVTATHAFQSPGEFEVTLTVYDDKGATNLTNDKVIVSFFYPDSYSLACDGSNLWYGAWSSEFDSGSDYDLYKMSSTTGVLSGLDVVQSPEFKAKALAWDGSNIWGYDGVSNKIIKVDPNDGSIIKALQSGDFHSMTWANSYLWGLESNKICKIDPSNGNYNCPITVSGQAYSLAWDGTYFWVSEVEQDELYKIDPSTGDVVEKVKPKIKVYSAQQKFSQLKEITWCNSVLWSVFYWHARRYDKLLKYDPANNEVVAP